MHCFWCPARMMAFFITRQQLRIIPHLDRSPYSPQPSGAGPGLDVSPGTHGQGRRLHWNKISLPILLFNRNHGHLTTSGLLSFSLHSPHATIACYFMLPWWSIVWITVTKPPGGKKQPDIWPEELWPKRHKSQRGAQPCSHTSHCISHMTPAAATLTPSYQTRKTLRVWPTQKKKKNEIWTILSLHRQLQKGILIEFNYSGD